jgi:farnesyl-diphosphate farnesyltransferase
MNTRKSNDLQIELNYTESLNYCLNILPNVSRSFAIGIQFLSGELRKSVLVGYLLCRIIDTVEDDLSLSILQKEHYLKKFIDCFKSFEECTAYTKIAENLSGDKNHIQLVANSHRVFHLYFSLSQTTQLTLTRWVCEMAKGMISFIKRYPNGIRLATLDEYKEYCYYVAGTVGHLLTDLWKEYGSRVSINVFNKLQSNASIFGEALQTVNILKDIAWDAKQENSIYIPSDILKKYGVSHEVMLNENLKTETQNAVREILNLAYNDIDISINYLKNIPAFNFRIRFFCIFPLFLAIATLKKIQNSKNILTPEHVIKVSRSEVKKIKIYSILCALSNFFIDRSVKKICKSNFALK